MAQPQPFKLIIEDDEGRRSIVPVDLGDVSLGRHESCVIRLKERNVSRRHARLALEDDGRIFVYDLDSYNGLWANGDRINGRFELHQGDVLRLGDFQLELKGEGLKPRREEATQRTRVQDVSGAPQAHTEPEISPPEPTQVDADVPPGAAALALGAVDGVPEATQTAVFLSQGAKAAPGPDLHAIMQEETALIRNPAAEASAKAPAGNVASDKPVVDAVLRPPFAKLLCLTTHLAGHDYTIEHGETVIGRTEDNEICLEHRSISRHHAKVLVSQARYRLVDLDSANGTLVNGEVYAQAELKRGDIIELGHVRLRFVPPGDSAAWTVEEQNHLARMQAQRRARGKLWRRSPLVLMLLAGSAIAGLSPLFVNPAQRRPQGAGANPNTRPGAATPASEVLSQAPSREATERLLVAARHAAQAHQFKKVESLAQEILQLEPNCDEAATMLRLCAVEKKSQTALDNAVQAAQASRWSEAYAQLQEVSKDSSAARPAQNLLAQVKPGVIDERLIDCRQALQKEDWDEAELLFEEMSSLDAARPEMPELKAAIRDGRAKHPGQAHSSRSSKSRKDPGSGAGFGAKASGASASGSSGSSRSAQGAAAGAAAVAPASTQVPAPGRDPKAMYAEGTRLLAAKQYPRAIEEYQKCVSADKNFAMCYRALGIAHANAGSNAEAVRYYRLYLKVDPSARDAAQVRSLLQQWEQTQGTQSRDGP